MKLAETKNPLVANKNIQKKQQPFFNKVGQGGFFSQTKELEKPFFNPYPIQAKLTAGEISENDKDETKNISGLPDSLKVGLEQLSGMDLSSVRVHQNSSKPSKINALAYTQGQEIYLSSGQEKHLPHEGWHVVQQMQGRVKPTLQTKEVSINDNEALEREADVMGTKALQVKGVEQTNVNSQMIGDIGHMASSSRLNTALRHYRNSAVDSASSALIQRVPVAPAVAAAIKALTFAEAITAVGTVVSSAASIVGLVGTAQNDKTGVSNDAIIDPTSGDYLMSDVDRDGLAQVFRVLYFSTVEGLVDKEQSRGTILDDAKQEELKQTALGNVKFSLTRNLAQRLTTTTEEFVQQGDGGTSKETPWGSVKVSVEGSELGNPSTSPPLVEIAERHQVTLPQRPLSFIKRVKLSFESEKDWNLTFNDDIWVRGTKLAPTQGSDLHVGIEAEVAFDWDGDTSRYEWDGPSLITFNNIAQPEWRGPSDPDD
ncbi:DUF4157 domain-containing protein [Subsaximicrobium wynnwilliamsii]|uniref:DUF4157 domain-containing protein n=1 Tax=Subsaximicrobium wynnwilliamsii TaxID=291179 RepID=A0A5C6ZMD0_9FLAO|nr:DUF4157 domain-containing protein [Subsaximicrobium wynnwilliamsii]TXD85059.1 DUF4157 domain-containing protein [Subsaximicrobium wynnwilliamsii]TXD91102.1 DUF4157 domain-containing protein [Subsaximicrobium wynnwilliamsii]TXE04496.1 DUF4157 domain-containing protein [Subsaximicrobium wynnwilliamsii]